MAGRILYMLVDEIDNKIVNNSYFADLTFLRRGDELYIEHLQGSAKYLVLSRSVTCYPHSFSEDNVVIKFLLRKVSGDES